MEKITKHKHLVLGYTKNYRPSINGNKDGTCHGQARYFINQSYALLNLDKQTRKKLKPLVFEQAMASEDRKELLFAQYYSEKYRDNVKQTHYIPFDLSSIGNSLATIIIDCCKDNGVMGGTKPQLEAFLLESHNHSAVILLKKNSQQEFKVIFFEPNTEVTAKFYFVNQEQNEIGNLLTQMLNQSVYFANKNISAISMRLLSFADKVTMPKISLIPDYGNTDYNTEALFMAVYYQDVDAVKFFLAQDVDVNQANIELSGITPLIKAIKNENNEIIQALLKHENINIQLRDSSGIAPIEHAMQLNNIELAMQLEKMMEINCSVPCLTGGG